MNKWIMYICSLSFSGKPGLVIWRTLGRNTSSGATWDTPWQAASEPLQAEPSSLPTSVSRLAPRLPRRRESNPKASPSKPGREDPPVGLEASAPGFLLGFVCHSIHAERWGQPSLWTRCCFLLALNLQHGRRLITERQNGGGAIYKWKGTNQSHQPFPS